MSRGTEEIAICNYLKTRGFSEPSQRVQRAMFPGATPAQGSSGKGRGAIVVDIGREISEGGIRVEQVAGIKASGGKTKKTTITVTTGTAAHCDAVVQGALDGLDIPIIVVHLTRPMAAFGPVVDRIEVAVVNLGAHIRACAGVLPRATKGQGKGRGNAEPVTWGVKLQTSKAGKTYEYVSIYANIAACGVQYQTVSSMAELADLIEESAESIYL